MLPEYLKYWGLSKPPFSLTPDPEMLYMSGQHQEGLLRLKYAVVSNKGGALLVSENAGDGKTSLLARLRLDLHQHYKGNCDVVFIDHPTLTANQMVGEIVRQLGIRSSTTEKPAMLNDLRGHLMQSYRQGSRCVVILDEGQMLCHRPDILQELRILLNFCVSDSFLLTFILSGQKPLDEAIRAMPEFHQRLPVRFFLRNLSREDTRELIRFRLHKAGMPEDREIFSEDGYTGIYNFSKGCPRVICSVADLSLVIAHSRYSRQADFVAVSQACSDMNRTEGGYHYHYFLKSFSEGAGETETVPEKAVESLCPNCGSVLPVAASQCHHCGKADLSGICAGDNPVDPEQSREDGKVFAGPDSGPESPDYGGVAPVGLPESDAPPERNVPDRSATRSDVPVKAETGVGGAKVRFEIVEPDDEEIAGEPDSKETGVPEEKASPGAGDGGKDPLPLEQESSALKGTSEKDDPTAVKCSFCGLLPGPGETVCSNCGEDLLGERKPVKDEIGPESECAQTGEPPAEPAAARDLCVNCGGTLPESELCPRCGSRPDGGSAEADLLAGIEKLGLSDLIVSARGLNSGEPADPTSVGLLFLAPGRFWSRSAVAQYFNGDGRVRFNSRCGLSVRGAHLTIMMRGEQHRLEFIALNEVHAEPVMKNGSAILYRLVLVSDSGRWLLTLPFRGERGRGLAELLARYVRTRGEVLRTLSTGVSGS